MQTEFKLFDLFPKGQFADGVKMSGKLSGREQTVTNDQLGGFMEIMGAMLDLERDQPEMPLDDLETMAESVFPIAADQEERGPAELIEMLWALSDAVGPQQQQSEGEQPEDQFMDLARALISDHTTSESLDESGADENFKEKWSAIFNQLRTNIEQGQTSQPETAAEPADQAAVQNTVFMPNKMSGGIDQKEAAGGALLEIESELPEQDESGSKISKSFVATLRRQSMQNRENASPITEDQQPQADMKSALNEKQDIPVKVEKEIRAAERFDLNDRSSKHADSIFGQTLQKSLETDQGLNQKEHLKAEGEALLSQAVKSSPELSEGFDTQDQLSSDDEAFSGKTFQRASAALGSQTGELSRANVQNDMNGIESAAVKDASMLAKEEKSDIIRQIVQRMSMNTQSGQSKMVIRLKPEFLGNVHMQVLTENHQVTVRMMADSPAVKEIVEQNLQSLKLDLQHHGLEIQKFDVFVGNDNQGWKNEQQQAGFGQAFRQRQQRIHGGKARTEDNSILSADKAQHQVTSKESSEIDYFA